jgi:hypothetical protein
MNDLYERYSAVWQRAVDFAKREVSEDLGALERADLVYEIVIIRYIVAGYHEDVNLDEFEDVVPEITSYLDRLFAHLSLQFDPRRRAVRALWARLLTCRFEIVACQPSEALFDLDRATDLANALCKTGLTRDSNLVALRFLVRRFKMRVGLRGSRSVTARIFELNGIAGTIGATVAEGVLSLDTFELEDVMRALLYHLDEESVPNPDLVQRLDNVIQHSLQ